MGWLVGFYFRLLSCCSAYCLLKTSFLAFSRNKTKNVRARAGWNSAQMSNRLQHISRRHHHQATSKCDKRASFGKSKHTFHFSASIVNHKIVVYSGERYADSRAGITCETEPRAREMRKKKQRSIIKGVRHTAISHLSFFGIMDNNLTTSLCVSICIHENDS